MQIAGKNILNTSIGKEKLNLITPVFNNDPIIKSYFDNRKINGKSLITDIEIDKTDIGIPLVDNTPDNQKPVSTPQAIAIAKKLSQVSISEFTASFDSTNDSFYLTDIGKTGIFKYDSTDTTSTADGILVLVKDGKRYKRQHNGVFYPEWWGITGKGLTNDATLLQAAITSANINSAELVLNNTYLVETSTIALRCNVSGFGTIKTKTGGTINVQKAFITVKDITIDGEFGGVPSGRGLYGNGYEGVTFYNVKVKNVVSQGVWLNACNNAKIIGSTFIKCRGNNGDSIYVRESKNPLIMGNHCSDFQRIGIVTEGSSANPTYDALIIGNICVDAFDAVDHITYPNAGIWCENTAGAIIDGNITKNTFDRGIVITPSVDLGTTHEYIISNNTVFNVYGSGSAIGTGIAVSYPANQIVNINNNVLTDCQRGMDVGECNELIISNNTFNRKLRAPNWFDSIIRWVPTTESGKKSNILISDCVNNIGNEDLKVPISIADDFGHSGNLTITNCIGNFAYTLGPRTLNGHIKVTNTLLDWTSLSITTAYISNNLNTTFTDCEIKLPSVTMVSAGAELIIHNCVVTAAVQTRIMLYLQGSKIIRIDSSRFDNVYFYDLRRADTEIYIRNTRFDNYSTFGIFQNTIIVLKKLEVIGCTFSESQTGIIPLQFTNGVTSAVLGNNIYYSNNLYSGFHPNRQVTSFTIGTTGQRPTVTQVGFMYFNTSFARFEYWNGTEWATIISSPTYVTNAGTTAPTKSVLNSLYSTYKAGSVITYPSISGGAREYFKLTDSITSDWTETIWSTGAKALTA